MSLKRALRSMDAGSSFLRAWHSPTLRVMSFTLFGMILSLVVDVLIAMRYGATISTDVLFLALGFPRLIEVLGREGTRLSLLALLVEVREEISTKKYHQYVSGILNLFLIVGIGAVVLSWILARPLMTVLGPGLASDELWSTAALLLRLSIPLTIFAFGSTIMAAYLNSQRDFIIAASRTGIVSAIVLIGLVVSWSLENTSAWIATSYAVGHLVYFVIIVLYSIFLKGFQYKVRSWPNRSALRELAQATLYPLMGLMVRQGSRLVERAIASTISPGGVTVYYLAFRLVSAAQTIVGVSAATTGLPRIANRAAKGDWNGYWDAIIIILQRVAFIGLPVTIFVALFSKQIITLLYGRGEMNAESIEQVAGVFSVLIFVLIFWSMIPVLNSGLFAIQKYSWAFWRTVAISVVNLFLAWQLSNALELNGIAIATVVAVLLGVVSSLVMIRYSVRQKAI